MRQRSRWTHAPETAGDALARLDQERPAEHLGRAPLPAWLERARDPQGTGATRHPRGVDLTQRK